MTNRQQTLTAFHISKPRSFFNAQSQKEQHSVAEENICISLS
jgi:hypothetical protein